MLNHTTVQGRLCADPELRTTPSGVSVCSFRVAWSEKYKEAETKLFLSCVAWRATGELVSKYFRKGQEIIVEGRLSTRDWTDRDGNKRQTIELTADKVHFCGPKQSEGCNAPDYGAPPPASGGFSDIQDEGDGELPF